MFSPEIMKLAAECEARLAPMFRAVDETAFYNTGKVLDVFREHRLSERHFNPSCGYGYNDDGRDLCDTLYAAAFGCEAGFARAQLISGTHALAVALYGVLRPGDTLFSVTGKPYDTLDSVIGFSGESGGDGSLADLGVKYRDIPLCGGKTSIGLFYEMLGGIRFISTRKNVDSMNLSTPVLFISGAKDPVGDMGRGVKRAYESFRRAGVRDVELKLYEGLRHEILNEDCRAAVCSDLWSWIEKHLH